MKTEVMHKESVKAKAAYDQIVAEIRNRTLAEAYLCLKDILNINQKEYCKKVKVNESRFSRVLTKVENSQTATI